MTEVLLIRTTCKICMEPRQLNSEGLCKRCHEWNESMDGTVLALIESGMENTEDE